MDIGKHLKPKVLSLVKDPCDAVIGQLTNLNDNNIKTLPRKL